MIQKPMRTSSVRIGGSEQIAGELRRYIEGNMSNSQRDGGTEHKVPRDADAIMAADFTDPPFQN